jgi:HEAT repeat protein
VRIPGAAALALLATLSSAAPRRSLEYAESPDRMVYAFLFGHDNTCRVIRRPAAPRLDFETLALRRYAPEWRGEAGEVVIAEFAFGSGRPLHVVPLNDGKLLVAFMNRAPDGGWPAQDRVFDLAQKDYSEVIDYSALPPGAPPRWPEPERALRHRPPDDGAAPALTYAFAVRETPGRLLVARQSEGDLGAVSEIVLFAIDTDTRKAGLPRRDELTPLLEDPEELLAAGAAWALGLDASRDVVPRLKAARVASGPARAVVAQALVRSGDEAARRTLKALLDEQDAAARRAAALALAELPPAASDADALAEAAADPDAATAELAGIALARLGREARNALMRLSHASKAEKRVAAARVLGRMDGAEEEARLLALACDPDVQTAAARALTRPPRAIRKENFAAFGKALLACARAKNAEAARRLSMLFWQAHVEDDGALAALVECTTLTPKAIWALNRSQGTNFATADDCKRWWQERKKER